MSNITITDLELSKELDKAALRKVSGGWYYATGYTYTSSWSPNHFNESFSMYETGGPGPLPPWIPFKGVPFKKKMALKRRNRRRIRKAA
jgi:hypothetical protein